MNDRNMEMACGCLFMVAIVSFVILMSVLAMVGITALIS